MDPEPLRHQVWELPEIKPQVTEYQRHRLVCPCCGETTCAELPAGVPVGQAGPRLVAFVGLADGLLPSEQAAHGPVPRRRSCGSLVVRPGRSRYKNKRPRRCGPPTTRWRRHCRNSRSWALMKRRTRKNGKAWLWTFVAHMFTVFAVRLRARPPCWGTSGRPFHGMVNMRPGQDVLAFGAACNGAGRI